MHQFSPSPLPRAHALPYSGRVEKTVFSAPVVKGAGRGKAFGIPTLNLSIRELPPDLEPGVYAVMATIDEQELPAAMHVGPRPTVDDAYTCEVHVLDRDIVTAPQSVRVTVFEKLRDIEKFSSTDALIAQMHADCDRARAILSAA